MNVPHVQKSPNMFRIKTLDHLVLTVKDIPKSIKFYEDILGFRSESFVPPQFPDTVRHALKFGTMKINLHPAESPYKPYAHVPLPGTADLCFILDDSTLEQVVEILGQKQVPIEKGPVYTTGANGKMQSVYIRDPDLNLIEIAEYL